jgi:hypothetical protein
MKLTGMIVRKGRGAGEMVSYCSGKPTQALPKQYPHIRLPP